MDLHSWKTEIACLRMLVLFPGNFDPGAWPSMTCPYCDSAKLRNSQFRAADLTQLLVLRLPVRCRDCHERSYVSVSKSRLIQRESKLRREQDKTRRSEEASMERPS